MIVVTLPDGSSYAACDELEIGSAEEPEDDSDDVADNPSEDLVLVMRHVKVRKGMKTQLAEMRREGESERDVVLNLPNRTVRVNGLQIDRRTREETRCTFEGFEVVA